MKPVIICVIILDFHKLLIIQNSNKNSTYLALQDSPKYFIFIHAKMEIKFFNIVLLWKSRYSTCYCTFVKPNPYLQFKCSHEKMQSFSEELSIHRKRLLCARLLHVMKYK